jgi:hypothetical protein
MLVTGLSGASIITMSGPKNFSGSSSSSSGGFVAPASGLTYENGIECSMDFASNGAADCIDSFSTLGSGAGAWVTDPDDGGENVWRTEYNADEDAALAYIGFTPSKYVYFEWEEYWDAGFDSDFNGKCNRLMSPTGGTLYLDHIYFCAPGDEYYGFVLQGADVTWTVENNGRTPDLPHSEWVTMAVEHKVSSGCDGYIKLWQKPDGGAWTALVLDYRECPHDVGQSFLNNQSHFIGITADDDSHLYGRAVLGGWISGHEPSTPQWRYIRNVKVYYNVSNAPT